MKMTSYKIMCTVSFLASLTATTFAKPICINADGFFTSSMASGDAYPNTLLDPDDPKTPDKNYGDPKKASVSKLSLRIPEDTKLFRTEFFSDVTTTNLEDYGPKKF